MSKKTRWMAWIVLLLAATSAPAQDVAFLVVVHESNPVSSMSKVDVSRMFLKKTTHWESGFKVKPVDQAASSAVRESFSKAILNREVRAIKAYWQKLLFSGRAAPPPELNSDREILEYVRNNTGAIGYVSAAAALGSEVKRLTLAD